MLCLGDLSYSRTLHDCQHRNAALKHKLKVTQVSSFFIGSS